ncbi:MAG: nicotinate-nucleotide--dimethylbenzimidazole phosphoribosyltransferase [Planctomycetota bacterium]|nr:nicotinate-nucleotide--dimethylbenzimidazole phosphoribosyltransferase [Planctomycetota bacterium]
MDEVGDVPASILRAIAEVEAPDAAWSARAAERQARLTMPPGSLGRLLEIGRQLASIQRTDQPVADPALIAVFAADHGIAMAGVSAYPQEVTGQMVRNFLSGGAAINVLAARVGAQVRVVDFGVAFPPEDVDDLALHIERIGPGTANFLERPAMSRSQAFRAVEAGLRLADRWTRDGGFRVIALGEMGIGNSTTASTLIAALTDSSPEAVVGRGTGVDDAGLARKRAAVSRAIALHAPEIRDLWDWLARVGGFEILGLAGLAIGAAKNRSLVVLDGLISTAAGLIAARLCPAAMGSVIAAHVGTEPGHRVALDALGLEPILDLGLRLGEGSGAALAIPILAASADLLRNMATFDSAGVSGPSLTSPSPPG